MSIFTKIGAFFSHLFNGAQSTWNHLEPQVQAALLHGAGVIDIINRNIDLEAPLVIDLIGKSFPDLTEEQLKNGLLSVASALSLITANDSPDLPTLIANIQKYLAGLDGSVWANISGTLARAIAIFLAPADTRFAAISALMEFVYQHFIKHDNPVPQP